MRRGHGSSLLSFLFPLGFYFSALLNGERASPLNGSPVLSLIFSDSSRNRAASSLFLLLCSRRAARAISTQCALAKPNKFAMNVASVSRCRKKFENDNYREFDSTNRRHSGFAWKLITHEGDSNILQQRRQYKKVREPGRRKNTNHVLEIRRRYVYSQDANETRSSRFHAPRDGRRDFLITASKKLELIKPPKLWRCEFSGREIQFRASAERA